MGLVLAALGPLLMLLAGLAWGLDVSDDVPFFAITAVIALIGAFLVSRFGTWGKVVGIIAGVLVALALFWTFFGLFTPASFFDFVPGILVIPGVLTAIISAVAAIRANRRGDLTPTATGGERRALRLIPTIMLVLAVLSGVLTFAGKSTASADDAAATVTLSDFEFNEDAYQFDAGSEVLVRNDDPFLHTFTIDELDINIALTPGSEELVEIPAQAGEFILYCQPHTSDPDDPSDEDMAADLTIR
ncbi:MAG: cupredoxin domain-containing protein [Actinomycetota bacterium]|nr:cupredoxin domain-containing protein [Actinomycetota bacterium]